MIILILKFHEGGDLKKEFLSGELTATPFSFAASATFIVKPEPDFPIQTPSFFKNRSCRRVSSVSSG
jgi:hypothetical protein